MSDVGPWRDHARSGAVLLGAWGYTHLTPVPAARHSLMRMTGLLTGPLCEWPANRVREISDAPRRGNLPDQLMDLFQHVTDVALFYFVGHGQLHGDELCLALTESPKSGPRRRTTGLPFADVREALYECDARTKIVILDCCFSGIGTLPQHTLAGSAEVDVIGKASGTGAFTMAASGAYRTAWHEPDQATGHPQTYFTKYLIDTIEQGLPDHPEGLSLRVIFDRTADALTRDHLPEPTRSVRHDADRFILAHNAALLRPDQPIQHRLELTATTGTNGQRTPPPIVAQTRHQVPETWTSSDHSGGNPASDAAWYSRDASTGPPQNTVPARPLPSPGVFRHTPKQRATLVSSLSVAIGMCFFMVIWGGISLRATSSHSNSAKLELFYLGIFGIVALTAGLVVHSRRALFLTQHGVYFRGWKTTFVRWSEIKGVQVRRIYTGRCVRFVLGDGSKTSFIPYDDWGMRDDQFDHKVSIIRQWHAQFGSPQP